MTDRRYICGMWQSVRLHVYAVITIIDVVMSLCAGDIDWKISDEATAPRGWAIIEALSPETVYEMRVVARSPSRAVDSASFIQRVRIGLKRGRYYVFLLFYYLNPF